MGLISQFLGQTAHFALHLLAAVVFLAVGSLYFDAWIARRTATGWLKWLGFFTLFLAFLIQATVVELPADSFGSWLTTLQTAAPTLRLLGYVAIVLAMLGEPLQRRPRTEGLVRPISSKRSSPPLAVFGWPLALAVTLPVGSGLMALLTWRRTIWGLERHLKTLAWGFTYLALADVLDALSTLGRKDDTPFVHIFTAAFGPLWWLELIVLTAAVWCLGRWVWRYLLRRFVSQLFIVFTTAILVTFLVATTSFTFLLLRNIKDASLANLAIAANVLEYALVGKQAQTATVSESIGRDPVVVAALAAGDRDRLIAESQTWLTTNRVTSIILTAQAGQVMLRVEDPERRGESLSDVSLVKRALVGTAASSVASLPGPVAPSLTIQSASPVRQPDGSIIGSVIVGAAIDNAFVDGIQRATGLNVAVYGGNIRSATTLTAGSPTDRLIGITEDDPRVKEQVLRQGQRFQGELAVANTTFLSVYAPILDVDAVVVGMLYLGQPLVNVLATANRSLEITFIMAVVLTLVALAPAAALARYLAYQVR